MKFGKFYVLIKWLMEHVSHTRVLSVIKQF